MAAGKQLEGPEPPGTLLYLLAWADELVGRSGATMGGLAPLSYPVIESWSRMMGVHVNALEVRALVALDAVMRNPEPSEAVEHDEPEHNHAWPEKDVG